MHGVSVGRAGWPCPTLPTSPVAIRRQRALLVVNAIALIAIALAAALLIPAHGAKGAAVASVIGEAALAGGAGLMLARGRKLLRPDVGSVLKILLAGGFAGPSSLQAIGYQLPASSFQLPGTIRNPESVIALVSPSLSSYT